MTYRLITLAIAASLATPAFADEASTLDRVVVTANRAPVAVRDVLAPVEVIDREDIERSQARSLPDLLRGRAGISIGNQGGLGKLTTIFMRGSESDHVLVLVDGVRMGSATSGLVAFQDIPVELIDRIEIVRGPRSSLYGSEAIGGVIQIFTKRDTGALAPRMAIGAGSRDTYEASAGFGGRVGKGWVGADYSHQETRGFDSCRGAGFPIFAGCFADEPDRDGYTRDALSVRGGVAFNDAWKADASAMRAEGDNEYDGFYNRSKVVQQVVGGGVTWTPSTNASLRLQAGRNRDASDNFHDDSFLGDFASNRDTASLQGDFTVAAGQRISAGTEWQRDEVSSTTNYVLKQRIDRAAFLQYQGDFGAFDVQASARHDDNEQFGGHSTGNLAFGYEFAPSWRVTLGGGTAFKAPTFNELYYPFGFGNPDLRPEKSRSIEAGLAWDTDTAGARLDLYQTHVDDLISYSAVSFRPENIDRARMRGAELSGHATFAGWTTAGSVSWVDPENRSSAASLDLPRRARESARLDVDREFGAFRFGVTAAGEGARYDDLANTRRLGAYATFDLRAEYAFTPALRLQARLENMFDRTYETVEYYRQPGRGLFVTLRYAPTP
ncbi:TonB-dependent vitamin B12 receptor [Lysobacter sp. TY2-98]|uniref:TonB-dependent vitamin B12 receptor n=1 Tax=Lysobacter sp. TY2-98 TaxID=2290922 RepID=UPI000E202E31|nr:TonB-dependent vitamin B12 receptor [Lysobacter sp. TY2-98]AXK72712.1 TonB-dependent vitamin B12 receptor [Lysobacter sp. TY2-98]